MRVIRDSSWQRRGISLLWGTRALAELGGGLTSIRAFLEPGTPWPEDLPSASGRALTVVGLEACIDVLTPEDAEVWLETSLFPRMLSFQDEYENQAALVLWMPAARQRLVFERSSGAYRWRCAPPNGTRRVELGRLLWGGAESEAARILEPESSGDSDGPGWIGLHHPRLS